MIYESVITKGFLKELEEDRKRYGNEERKKEFNEVRREIKKQIREGQFEAAKLGEQIESLHTNRFHIGRLLLENEKIKINKLGYNYRTKVGGHENLSYCRIMENKFRESKIKSYKCPGEYYGNFFNYRIIRDDSHDAFCVHSQISAFYPPGVYYGDLVNLKENEGNPIITINLSHISDLKGIEKTVFEEVDMTFNFDDLKGLHELAGALNKFFQVKRIKSVWSDDITQDSYECTLS